MLIDKNLLSIVIPTRNRANYLCETLTNLLNKIEYEIEIIIIDGNSTDNTEEVINYFLKKYDFISYFKITTNKGFDSDLNFGINKANSKFCWMFSDDDIVNGVDLNNIIEKIQKLKHNDLILVNASVYNIDFSELIQKKLLNINESSGENSNILFENYISYLSFFGGCIINREYWINSNPERYFGSLFVHIGVIFSKPNLKWHWISDPIIKIRYGNASWTNNSLEIWLILWPKLIHDLNFINLELKRKYLSTSPFAHFKKFILFKALGKYNEEKASNIFISYNKIYLKIIQILISVLPKIICYYISYVTAKIYKKNTILYDLKSNS